MFSRLSHPKDEVASSILVRGYVMIYELRSLKYKPLCYYNIGAFSI